MILDLSPVIRGVVAVLSSAQGVGTVNDREGGKSTWAAAPRPRQTYWIVDKSGRVSIPNRLRSYANHSIHSQMVGVCIDGWMPLDPSLQTVDTWMKRCDDVLLYLSQRSTLDGGSKMLSLPDLVANDVQPYTSPAQNDIPVLCHHCRIEFPAILIAR